MRSIQSFLSVQASRASRPLAAERTPERSISDAQALKELIEILKKPYQCNCDRCSGTGVAAAHDTCKVCQGTGRILIDLL